MDQQVEPSGLIDTTICRRTALLGLGAVGLAGLAACSAAASPSSSKPAAGPATSSGAGASTGTAASSAPASSAAGGGGGGAKLVALADVPVGGAVSAKSPDGKPILISQPTAGKVVAFSAVCKHQGATVGAKGVCPLHGSTYDLATGAVTKGPATSGLDPIAVKVDGGEVVTA